MATYNTTVISANAFKNNTLMKTAVAKSILSVQESAFEGCTSLADVTLNNCTTIEDHAFENCVALKDVKGVDNVKKIGNFAFAQDNILSAYDFPECSSIGYGAFATRSNFTRLNATIDSIKKEYMNFPKCKEIGDYAFFMSTHDNDHNQKDYFGGNTSLDFPECEKIGDSAFEQEFDYYWSTMTSCFKNISSLNFPKCKEIGKAAFAQGKNHNGSSSGSWNGTHHQNSFFYNISSLYFPECEKIGDEAFKHALCETNKANQKLKDLNFPKCKEIGDNAFETFSNRNNSYLHALSSMNFPVCEKVGSAAFHNTKANAPFGFEMPVCLSVMDSAFSYSLLLSSISLPNCKYLGSSVFTNSTLKQERIDLPNIEKIGNDNFNTLNCANLTSIAFGPKLSSIGTNNFQGISNRNSIKLSVDENNEWFSVDYNTNVLYSKSETDPKGKGLIDGQLFTQNVFDDDIDYVKTYALAQSNVSSFSSLSCKHIEDFAFAACTNLNSLNITKVVDIGANSFYNTGLNGALELPECSSIGEYAFGANRDYQSNIKTIYIPKCETIGNYAFCNTSYMRMNYTNVVATNCLSIHYGAFTRLNNANNCAIKFGRTVPKLIKENGSIDAYSQNVNYIQSGVTLLVPETSFNDYKTTLNANSVYTLQTYDADAEESRTQFAGYYYQGNAPTEGEATIEEMTDYNKLTNENPEIPEIIPDEN